MLALFVAQAGCGRFSSGRRAAGSHSWLAYCCLALRVTWQLFCLVKWSTPQAVPMHACHAGLVDVLHALCASARTSPQFGVERDLHTLASAQLPKSSSCVLGGSGAPGDVPGTAMKPLTIRSTGFCLILLFVLPGGFALPGVFPSYGMVTSVPCVCGQRQTISYYPPLLDSLGIPGHSCVANDSRPATMLFSLSCKSPL